MSSCTICQSAAIPSTFNYSYLIQIRFTIRTLTDFLQDIRYFCSLCGVAVNVKYVTSFIIINTNYKTSIALTSSKRIELSGAPSGGVGQHIVRVRCEIHQQIIRWQGNLGRIGVWKVSFQMVTERNYAIWWLHMIREWIPKSRDGDL